MIQKLTMVGTTSKVEKRFRSIKKNNLKTDETQPDRK